jgi:hypothetical protein
LIDEGGVSGLFTANNLVNYDEGSANGWPVSVEGLRIKLAQNKIVEGGMEGLINVAFLNKESNKNDALKYSALIRVEEDETVYSFSLSPAADKIYNMPFGGTLTLDSNSRVSIEKYGKKWYPKAVLHGKMQVGDAINIPDIAFQDLTLSTDKPYLHKGTFSLGQGNAKLGNFRIGLDKLSLGLSEGKLSLGAEISVSFGEATDKLFAAETFVSISAHVEESHPIPEDTTFVKHKWKFDGVKVHDVFLETNTTAFALKGTILFRKDDPVFGNGFKGEIELKIPALQGKKVVDNTVTPIVISATFGSMPTYRYWQFGAVAPVNIPIGVAPPPPGKAPFRITGIMLGAAYRMERMTIPNGSFNMAAKIDITNGPSMQSMKDQIFSYRPNANIGISLLAGVNWVVAKEKACNGDAALEIAFNAGGGLRFIRLDGSAYFMMDVATRTVTTNGEGVTNVVNGNTQAPLYAKLSVMFDHNNATFHANMQAWINVQNGVKGAGTNGLIGEVVIHVDPKDWYIYIGRASQRLGVIVLDNVRAEAYLMVGTKIEGLPLPPMEVMSMYNKIREKGQMRNEEATKEANGIATGARLQLGIQQNIAIFYVAASIGGGYDMMIYNASNAKCDGNPVGINGWYAEGQAYIFLNAEVAIAPFKNKERRFTIMQVSGAALLLAKFPKPTWLAGGLRGSYNILGGLIQGDFDVQFSVGKDCQFTYDGQELETVVIQDISPSLGANAVSVFSAPQVSFNVPIGTPMNIVNLYGKPAKYRVQTDGITIKTKADGQPILGDISWNSGNEVMTFNPNDILPGEKTIIFEVKIKWQRQNDAGGWDDMNMVETKTAEFTTSKAPDYIPDSNIKYAYPSKGQYNYHKQEAIVDNNGHNGYLILNQGQPRLFDASTQENGQTVQWEYIAQFVTPNQLPITSLNVKYDSIQRKVSFQVPVSLNNKANYKVNFIKRSVNPLANSANNVDKQSTNKQLFNNPTTPVDSTNLASLQQKSTGTLTIKQVKLTNVSFQSTEKVFYKTHFRVSEYDKFSDKVIALTNKKSVFDVANYQLYVLGHTSNTTEIFDKWEMVGNSSNQQPLVQAAALNGVGENPWYATYGGPNLYNPYAVSGLGLQWRTTPTGLLYSDEASPVVPSRAVRLSSGEASNTLELTESMSDKPSLTPIAGKVNINYFVTSVAYRDYQELRNKIAYQYFNTPIPTDIAPIFNNSFSDIVSGTYKVSLRYVLPGKTAPNSSVTIDIIK